VRVAHDCWIDVSAADDLRARCMAVLDKVGPDSVISSVTAARLHGLWLPTLPETIHVATATPDLAGHAMSRSKRPEIVGHRLQLAEDDVVVAAGVPMMSSARAWRDLAAVLGLPDLVAAGDSVLRGGTSISDVAAVVERTRNRRHARKARAALLLLDARSRSRPESHLRVAITVADLPRFEVNEPVYRGEGGWLAEPDLSLVEAKLALEYQGEEHATVSRMRRDITRERDLRADDWLTYLYGPAEVFGRPWSIAPEVRAVIRVRAPHLIALERRRGTRRIARVVR
jgi:hypothetical protein